MSGGVRVDHVFEARAVHLCAPRKIVAHPLAKLGANQRLDVVYGSQNQETSQEDWSLQFAEDFRIEKGQERNQAVA